MSFPRALLLVATSLLTVTVVVGQQPQDSRSPTGLALEVFFYKGAAPAYETVTRADNQNHGSWFGAFGRIPNFPAGELPVNAVKIASYQDGDIVVIKVSVLRGRFHDAEDPVGTYRVRTNEKVVIKELSRFGVEPFVIRVVRAGSNIAASPSVVSKAKSLECVSIEPLNWTFPAYKLTLHNLSDKNISAVQVNVEADGKVLLIGMPQGKDGLPLIEAGGFYELNQPLETKAQPSPGGYFPTSPPPQQVVIAAVVFQDGSYEGQVQASVRYRALAKGRQIQLKRIVALLENHTAAADPDSADAITQLRQQVSSLSMNFDNNAFAEFVKSLPELDPVQREGLRATVEIAMHRVTRMLLDDLAEFEKQQSSSAANFQSWLTATRERYQKWLSRL